MLHNKSKFIHTRFLKTEQLKSIFAGIINAYRLMLKECSNIPNRETQIRNYLHEHYLNDGIFKENFGLTAFHFDVESGIIKDNKEKGFIDIKVITKEVFKNPKHYYIIECKRLDGDYKYKKIDRIPPHRKGSLAVEYIKEGIMRFIRKDKYPTTLGVNGMIGFIVQSTDIDEGIKDVNTLITTRFPESKTQKLITKNLFIPKFNYSYVSTHKDAEEKTFDLYHLMLDFSSIIA